MESHLQLGAGQASEELQDCLWSIALKAVETIRAISAANVASLDVLKSRKQSLLKTLPTERAERMCLCYEPYSASLNATVGEKGFNHLATIQGTRASLHSLEQLLLEMGSTSKTLSNFWLDRRAAFQAFSILFDEERINEADQSTPSWWNHRQLITSSMEQINQAHDSLVAISPTLSKEFIDKHSNRRGRFTIRRFTSVSFNHS